MIIIALSIVVVLSNAITAQYISYKVESKIRMEMEGISHQIAQIQRQNRSNVNYVNYERDKKWDDVMSPTELAQYLDIELDQVYHIINNKGSGIPYICIDDAYRFGKDAINEWLTSEKSIIINSIR